MVLLLRVSDENYCSPNYHYRISCWPFYEVQSYFIFVLCL